MACCPNKISTAPEMSQKIPPAKMEQKSMIFQNANRVVYHKDGGSVGVYLLDTHVHIYRLKAAVKNTLPPVHFSGTYAVWGGWHLCILRT